MKYKPNVEEVIERFEAFWNRDKLDRIPIRIRIPTGNLQAHESYLEAHRELRSEQEEKWEDIVLDPEKYFNYWEQQLRVSIELADDTIPTASPDLGPALMGGMMGADISFKNGTSWSEHPLTDWGNVGEYAFNPSNRWVTKIVEMTKYFIEQSEGLFAVGLPNLTGPADILASLRGPTQVCLDLYENPDALKELSERCAAAQISAFNTLFATLPQYFGGTCELYMYWTPGRAYWLSCDLSLVLSPALYRQHFREFDQVIVDFLDTCWMHVHSGGAFMVNEFLQLEGLKGVQIVNDTPAGPDIKALVPVFQEIQKRHCLILRKYSIDEVKSILPELEPAGLFVDTQCDSLRSAQESLEEWSKFTKSL